MEVFNVLFGTVEYGEHAASSHPPDCSETLDLLAKMCPPGVMATRTRLRQELAGGHKVATELVKATESLRLHGNSLYGAGEFEEASKAYKAAIYENHAFDPRVYTNAAMTLIRLGRYEEAVIYSQLALQLDATWLRSLEQLSIAYCHLGYIELAMQFIERLRRMDTKSQFIDNAVKQVASVKSSLSIDQRHTLNRDDVKRAVQRIVGLGNMEDCNEKDRTVFLFLLFHLSFYGEKYAQDLFDCGFMRLFRQVPIVKKLFSPNVDFVDLSPFECCVIERVLELMSLVSPADADKGTLSDQTLRELITLPNLLDFLCSLGLQIVKRSGLRAIATSPFHAIIVEKLSLALIMIDASPALRKRFIQNRSPLNDPAWNAYFWIAAFCAADPLSNPLSVNVFGRLAHLADEEADWFFDPWRHSKNEDLNNFIAMTLNICVLINMLEGKSHCTLVPTMIFWVAAVKDSDIAAACVNRPGIAWHLLNRFVEAVKEISKCSKVGIYRQEMTDLVSTFAYMFVPLIKKEESLPSFWEKLPKFAELLSSFS